MNKDYVVSGYLLESTSVELSAKAVENYKNGTINFETLLGNPEYFTELKCKDKTEAVSALQAKKTELHELGNSNFYRLIYYQLFENYSYPDNLDEVEDTKLIGDSGEPDL